MIPAKVHTVFTAPLGRYVKHVRAGLVLDAELLARMPDPKVAENHARRKVLDELAAQLVQSARSTTRRTEYGNQLLIEADMAVVVDMDGLKDAFSAREGDLRDATQARDAAVRQVAEEREELARAEEAQLRVLEQLAEERDRYRDECARLRKDVR